MRTIRGGRLVAMVAAIAGVMVPSACDPTGGKRPPAQGVGEHFTSSVRAATRAELGWSWREGCPVSWNDLSVVAVAYWGYDGNRHVGALVVHDDVAASVERIFAALYNQRFQIDSIEPIDAYRGDDTVSTDHNNTSGFNCRNVAGSSRWSTHASGRAIDINPQQNPWVQRTSVSPAGGKFWLDRSKVVPGMVVDGDLVTHAFEAEGWTWGGRWSSSKDYQHFER